MVLDLVLAGQGSVPALAMDIGHKAIGFENARITHALHNQCAERFCAKFARVSRMDFMDRKPDSALGSKERGWVCKSPAGSGSVHFPGV